jgi:Tfp pilus assembly protein PilX
MNRNRPPSFRRVHLLRRAAERGVTLLFALLTLVALSLAAVALVRSVDTASLVAGNLGFKQDSTAFAGQAAEQAIAWLDLNKIGNTLDSQIAASAYYPVAFANLDPTNNRPADILRAVVDWDGNGCATPYAAGSFATCLESEPMTAASVNGTTARFVITRLCTAALPATDPANACARPVGTVGAESGDKNAISYATGPRAGGSPPGPYFRIVARAVGARNTISYTETIVHF